MAGWTIRVEKDEVVAVGNRTGFNHTSISIYGPDGSRGAASIELVRGGELGVTFGSADRR